MKDGTLISYLVLFTKLLLKFYRQKKEVELGPSEVLGCKYL